MSLLPSCTHVFMIQGSCWASPMTLDISRQRLECSIQKSRIDLSGFERLRSPLLAWENDVELKSSLMPFS